jgi:hypothetical protein
MDRNTGQPISVLSGTFDKDVIMALKLVPLATEEFVSVRIPIVT